MDKNVKTVKAIFSAIYCNDLRNLCKLFETINFHEVSIELIISNSSKDTVLHAAARTGNRDIIKFLLNNGCVNCLQKQNSQGKHPLHDAAQCGNIQAVQLLIEAGAALDPLNRAEWTPLMLAVTKCDDNAAAVVEALLCAGSNPQIVNKDGWTAAHVCCRSGNKQSLQCLLEKYPAACNVPSKNGRSPLHTAVFHGHEEFLSVLHEHGCTLSNAKDACGSTPLMDGLRRGHINTVRQLLGLWPDTDVSACDVLGRTALHVAAEAGEVFSVEYVLDELQLDKEHRDEAGQFAVHSAAKEGQSAVVELLVKKYGCDVNVVDNFGRSAIWYARTNRRQECVRKLLTLGASLVP